MVDYRAESYKRIAASSRAKREAAAKVKEEEQKKSSVRINPKNIVRSGSSSQIAVSGGISENVLVSSPTSPVINGSSTASVSSDNPFLRKDMSQQTLKPSVTSAASPFVSTGRTTVISGFTAAKLAREQPQPQSIRGDIPYKVNIPDRDKTKYTLKSVDKNANNNNNTRYNFLGLGNLQNKNFTKNPEKETKLFERDINIVNKYEEKVKERGERLNKFFPELIKNSPFRNNEPLTFTEKVGALGLAQPAAIVLNYPEQIAVTSAKASLALRGAFNPVASIRKATKEELKAARSKTPFITTGLKSAFNIKTPEGIINTANLFTAPSFFKKGIETAKAPSYIGKTLIPAETIVKPEVLSGEQTFPYVKGQTPAQLKKDFETSIYQKPIKEIIGFEKTGGFSGSPAALKTSQGVLPGSSATPGLYIAPSLSKYFLKLGSEKAPVKFNLLPNVKSPSANYIITEVGLIPESIVKGAKGNINKLNIYFKPGKNSIAGTGKSAISPEYYAGKPESEAITGVGSALEIKQPKFNLFDKVTGFKYYTVIEGKKVPIRIIEAQKSNKLNVNTLNFKDIAARRAISSSSKNYLNEYTVIVNPVASTSLKSSSLKVNALSSSKISSNNRLNNYSFKASSAESFKPSRVELIKPVSYIPSNSISRVELVKPSNAYSLTPSRVELVKPSNTYTPTGSNLITAKSNITKIPEPETGLFKGKRQNNSFGVDVKSFGKFKTIGSGLSFGKALSIGKLRVGTSAAATFRITKDRIPVKGINLGSNFYTKPSGDIIEKPSFRIKSRGELQEITFKGLKSQRLNL